MRNGGMNDNLYSNTYKSSTPLKTASVWLQWTQNCFRCTSPCADTPWLRATTTHRGQGIFLKFLSDHISVLFKLATAPLSLQALCLAYQVHRDSPRRFAGLILSCPVHLAATHPVHLEKGLHLVFHATMSSLMFLLLPRIFFTLISFPACIHLPGAKSCFSSRMSCV